MTRNDSYSQCFFVSDCVGDVWWEGKTEQPPKEKVFDWQGREWTKDNGRECADKNSRFTVKGTCTAPTGAESEVELSGFLGI